ncbi:MAG TPA: hypothetical protein VH595_12110 [Verrucomicrobiae bacterium]|jgi:hypothetical protein|nr:hypothetical protein [Verrucomicrobiae bacterium]
MNSSGETSLPLIRRDASITAADLGRWLRLLLARNPFYILSALLLLYSMRLLSGDTRLFSSETPQLLFNFSAFQVYELLLALTAILLARRAVWYDSGLLVGVETLFIFVPFILVSQALLLSDQIALAFCVAGCVLAAARTWNLKRRLPESNLPGPLLGIGALLLVLNVALPVVTRLLHKNVDIPVWEVRGARLQSWEWKLIVPMVIALAALLPRKQGQGGKKHEAFYARRYFPLLASLLWVAGTGAHLYCIGYVYGLPWEYLMMVPAVWTAAWLIWWRQGDLEFISQAFARVADGVLLAAPLAILVIVGWSGAWRMVAPLAILSILLYGCVAVFKKDAKALYLGLISLGLVGIALAPVRVAVHHAEQMPAGLEILLASFVLFGLGTLAAMAKTHTKPL